MFPPFWVAWLGTDGLVHGPRLQAQPHSQNMKEEGLWLLQAAEIRG